MPIEPSFSATCRNLSASRTHRRSFPDPPIPLPAPISQSASNGTHETGTCTFLFDSPASADPSADTFKDCQHHESVPNTRNKVSSTHPINIHPLSFLCLLPFSQHLELISFSTKIKEVDKCTSNYLFWAFSLATRSS